MNNFEVMFKGSWKVKKKVQTSESKGLIYSNSGYKTEKCKKIKILLRTGTCFWARLCIFWDIPDLMLWIHVEKWLWSLLQVLERELLEARGQEGKKVKEKFFTEATKLVFTIYFRILKSFPRSNLMGQSLLVYFRLYCSVFFEFLYLSLFSDG